MSLDISYHKQCTHIATVWYWGLCQSVELPGWSWNLRNVNCSCHGSICGGYRTWSLVKLTFLISVFGIYPYIYIYIYILHTSQLICITMRLWIFLSTDNVLTLQQYGTSCGGGQLVELPGWSWNLRNVNCSCHGSVLWGVYHMCSLVKLTFLISVFGIYLYIYIYIYCIPVNLFA